MRPWLLSFSFLALAAGVTQAAEPCKSSGACPETGCPAAPCCTAPATCTASAPCKSEAKVKTAAPCCSASATVPSCCVAVPAPTCPFARHNGSSHAELVRIITETDSADTFMVAVVALMRLEDNHPRAMPLVVRKAEQLGILKGISTAEKLTPAQCAVMDYLTGGPGPEQNAPAAYPVSTTGYNMVPPAPTHLAPPTPMTGCAAPPAPPMPPAATTALFRTWFDWVAHCPCNEDSEDK